MAPMTNRCDRSTTVPTSVRRAAMRARTGPVGLYVAVGVAALMAALTSSSAATPTDGQSGRSLGIEIRRDLRDVPTVSVEVSGETAYDSARRAVPADTSSELQAPSAGSLDPLVERQERVASKASTSIVVDINVPGLGFSGATPADVTADIGSEWIVQAVNATEGSIFAVFERASGAMIAGPIRIESLWPTGGACSEGWGHAGVVFDPSAARWLLYEIGAGNHLCVYVSQAADPVTGNWHAYDFELSKFPDFPRIGVWTDSYIVTTNEDLPAVYAFERAAMLSGSSAAWVRFTAPSLDGFGFQALTPVDLEGVELPPAGAGGLVVRHVDGALHGGGDRLELFELGIDWGSPQSSSISGPTAVALAAFDSTVCGSATRSCVPQPGTAVALDPVREVVSSRSRYRNHPTHESLVGNFTVDATGSDRAGIRWFELRRSGASWALHQEGTYSPDGRHRWIGGLAADRDGNVALVHNVSDDSSTFPSISLTGREADDPAGIMTAGEIELQTGTSPQTVGRSPSQWGWSTALSVDPNDDCTFLASAAFTEGGAWSTRLVTFRFPTCDAAGPDPLFADGFESGDTGVWSLTTP